ncbi:MAG TPA: DUF3047 domain-containing protein [Rhodospirillales bacterium]|nr:DUF3047 domain-containing protein [Rhodospirillales bacterium]
MRDANSRDFALSVDVFISAGMRIGAIAGLAAVLSSCAAGQRAATVAPNGQLEVLGIAARAPGFSPNDLPENWVFEGSGDVVKTQIAVVEKEGVKALKVMNSNDGFIVARRTKAMMLATPYLTWAWNMDPHGSGRHPVRVVAGFNGGARNDGSPRSRLGSALPPHDRALAVIWGESALQRGTLTKPSRGRRAAPLYTIRGGRENDGTWWLETVDLSRLYADVWPDDRQGAVEVVFIGVAAAGGRKPTAAYISEIKLSR